MDRKTMNTLPSFESLRTFLVSTFFVIILPERIIRRTSKNVISPTMLKTPRLTMDKSKSIDRIIEILKIKTSKRKKPIKNQRICSYIVNPWKKEPTHHAEMTTMKYTNQLLLILNTPLLY
jgi:hypothetical protein